MTPYDTYNLRHFASFSVPIFKGVFWVPVNTLGKTRYKTEQIQRFTDLSPNSKHEKVESLYEAIQLLQLSRFHTCEDNVVIKHNNAQYAIHTMGVEAVAANSGCCASVANWISYILKNKYDEVGVLSILSDIGVGHAVNYIYHQNKWYVLDANAFLKENSNYICAETGDIADFRKSKIITGALFQVDSLESFANFFSTYIGRIKRRTFLYCQCPEEIQWEGYRKLSSGQIETFWSEKGTKIIGTPPTTMIVKFVHSPSGNVGQLAK